MQSLSWRGASRAVIALALVAGAFGPHAAISKSKKPPVAEAPPPPPPAPPPITLSSDILEAAGAYRAYMARAAAIDPAFVDGAAVAAALRTGETYEPGGLMRGAVAYGAVAALQAPTFVAELRGFAVDANQRRVVADAILADPRYALAFRGADEAASRVVTAIGDDGLRLAKAGLTVKQSAYDIQKSDWSKGPIQDRAGRLAEAKAALTLARADAADVEKLRSAALGLGDALVITPSAAQPPYSPLVIQSLAVAALASLGEAGDDRSAAVTPMLDEPKGGPCLSSARRNLYQCLAVAGPHYEDVFCLGQHAMIDTGVCLVRSSGATLPAELIPPPLAVSIGARPYKSPEKAKTKRRRG
jgi:hypothetical protein